jgi:hypothetical protein
MAEYNCECGLLVKTNVVKKEGPTQGKTFISCPNGKKAEGGCGYFAFLDQNGNPEPSKFAKGGGGKFPIKKALPTPYARASPIKQSSLPPRSEPQNSDREVALKLILDRLEVMEQDQGNFKTCYDEITALRSDVAEVKQEVLDVKASLASLMTPQD